ncbi:MAG: leucine-rich repeat domain-containing protein [Bacteroidales bacterium]|nr:leucine-rich repeat domain-containing protein [Bacteroidales bacterium]
MKRILFITLAVLLSTLSASAYDFKVNGIAYSLLDNGQRVCVTRGGDYTGSVIIPERVTCQGTTYSVTSIGDCAFQQCAGLTSVTIPKSVTKIGEQAFWYCRDLTSVTIPNSVTTIGRSAFEDCTSLTSVIIGTSVTEIGESAFEDCKGLTSVTIPNSVTSIGKAAFWQCTGLTSVIIGTSVFSICSNAFDGCTGLTSVTIPNSVRVIWDCAFCGCTGLSSVIIGNSVQLIDREAFWRCTTLKKIYSLNPEPPQFGYGVSNDAFDSYNKNLFVPKGCVSKYKNAAYWRNFKFIGEIEEEGGIDDVVGADSKIKYDGGTITISVPSEIAVYSIDGRLVATANGVSLDTESLTHGTYVVRAVDAHGNVQTLKFIK